MDVRRAALLAVLLLAGVALLAYSGRQEEAATPTEPPEATADRREGAGTPTEPAEATADRREGTASAESAEVAADRAALVALYRATGGDDWDVNTNWLEPVPLNTWFGVTTGAYGRVTGLSLKKGQTWETIVPSPRHVAGPIPPELGDLTSLRVLDLSFTRLSGPIPPELGNLAHLEVLSFRHTQVSGPIPPELGNLARLKRLVIE